MRFYQIIVLVLLGFCASPMETPPSARKRGFKLEFVGDISVSMHISAGLSEFSFFIKHFHETLQMNFSGCLIKEMRNIRRACASVQAYLSFFFVHLQNHVYNL